jgi:GST-like protein
MIEFYAAKTPNVFKVHIMLEELGLPYTLHNVDLQANDQKKPDFLKVNPNGKVPAIVDTEGVHGRAISLFESGAILDYLADKSYHFRGENDYDKAQTMSWLMFQMSGVGPIFGNYNYAKKNEIPLMANRFEAEAKRVLDVMNTQLAQHTYLAGNFYSIADIATYPWIGLFMKSKPEWFEMTPHVRRWAAEIAKRPAVQKVMGV